MRRQLGLDAAPNRPILDDATYYALCGDRGEWVADTAAQADHGSTFPSERERLPGKDADAGKDDGAGRQYQEGRSRIARMRLAVSVPSIPLPKSKSMRTRSMAVPALARAKASSPVPATRTA